ncbi:7146_t:CDS:2 [Cetraspora pellucida]|uniref:7146_t:CDS:1 n=1 Tax=Cetraspora pellucida TaxID=1433469 RepID=A0ACA9NCH8_9GLOM|nr:7146_t:CDS:2 [Cetraspora pellucida]
MWCSRIRYPFRTLLENNPKYFSKNGFIYMTERSRDRDLHNHLKKCITEKHLAYSKAVWKNERVSSRKSVSLLSPDEIEKIYQTYWVMYSKGLAHYSYDYLYEGRKRIVNHLINNAKVIQRAWRAFKLRPKTWAKLVWNIVRNDDTPDEKKFLGITSRDIRISDNRYVWYIDRKILVKDVFAYH